MDLIIKKAWTEDENYHAAGFVDGAEFYVSGLSDGVITNPQQLTEEQIQEITYNIYDLKTKVLLSVVQ